MNFSVFYLMLQRLSPRGPLLFYAATWTILLTLTVAVGSFAPELAFVSVISPPPMCNSDGYVRVPLDVPTEVFCIPSQMFRRSKMDLVVPPIFAAVIVFSSAYVVRALALWEVDEEIH